MVKKIIGIFSAVLCISMCLILPDTVRADEGPENEPAVYSELGTEEDGINTENINETTGAENISAPESGVNAEPGEVRDLGQETASELREQVMKQMPHLPPRA